MVAPRRGNAFVLLLLAIGCIANAPATAQDPLRLGTNVWPGYEPLYLARERGLLDEEHVKLVEYRSATQVMQALETGSIDAGALTLDEVLTVAADGVELTVVLVVDLSSGGDAIVARPEIQNMDGLRGKHVGVENTALGAYVLLRALQLSGMSYQDVVVERLEISRHEEAYKERRIEASVCFEPVRTRLVALGGRELFSSREIPGEIVDVVAVRSEAIKGHRDALRELGLAWNSALAYMAAQPVDAYATIGRRMGLDAKEAREAYNGLSILNREESARVLASEEFRKNTIQQLTQFMLGQGLVERIVIPNLAPETLGTE